MLSLSKKPPRKKWIPLVRFGTVLILVLVAGWGAIELGQRYFGIQMLRIEHVDISGCKQDRLFEVQKIADELCKGKQLFLFDADQLQTKIESLRWVMAVLIRRVPPDRISIVIEERQPLLMLVRPKGVLLMSEDGIIMDRVSQSNISPVPVVADTPSQEEEILIKLVQVARALKAQQPDFYARLTELRWANQGLSSGPTVFLDGVPPPIYLSKLEPAKNIPSFQALFLQMYVNRPDLSNVHYFDLRWENKAAVRELPDNVNPRLQRH
ncbi:MAG: FtsQ-type POTRA domain-containing protein [Holophagaceae bacterium]|nr:FtsQ-type POTRA domain-containing protein [Holophagaceae bacterium]